MDSLGINPGESTSIEIGLRNNADEDVTDVSVFLDLKDIPFAPFDSSSEYGINEIRDGKTKFAKFKIIALNNAKPQTYKIPVQVSYLEGEENLRNVKKSLISIDVKSDPVVDVSVEDNLLLKGKENLVSIKIINKGIAIITPIRRKTNCINPKPRCLIKLSPHVFFSVTTDFFIASIGPRLL